MLFPKLPTVFATTLGAGQRYTTADISSASPLLQQRLTVIAQAGRPLLFTRLSIACLRYPIGVLFNEARLQRPKTHRTTLGSQGHCRCACE